MRYTETVDWRRYWDGRWTVTVTWTAENGDTHDADVHDAGPESVNKCRRILLERIEG